MKILSCLLLTLVLTGCSTLNGPTVTLPLLEGWYEGQSVFYITTEVSDVGMAREMQANYAPRLIHAVPEYPKPPQLKTILERVYGFPGKEQAKNVFASIPEPLGPDSRDGNYSPVWLMFEVIWQDGRIVRELRSEEEILAAEEAGDVELRRTSVVVNCPIVSIDGKNFLPVSAS